MNSIVRFIISAALLVAAFASSACTGYISATLKGKIPPVNAKVLTIAVNVPVIGGGSVEVKGQTITDGKVHADVFDEKIQTGYGSLIIHAEDADITRLAAPAAPATTPTPETAAK